MPPRSAQGPPDCGGSVDPFLDFPTLHYRTSSLDRRVTKSEDSRVQIDPRRHLPIYLQIAEAIRGGVAAGTYRPGEALPSLRELAVTLRVNPNTVQRAYDELSREGIVESRRGLGLFVAEPTSRRMPRPSNRITSRPFRFRKPTPARGRAARRPRGRPLRRSVASSRSCPERGGSRGSAGRRRGRTSAGCQSAR